MMIILPSEVLEYLATHAKFKSYLRGPDPVTARQMTNAELALLAEECEERQGDPTYTRQDNLSYEVWASIIDYEQKVRYLHSVEEIRKMLTDFNLCARENVERLIEPLLDLVE